MSGCIRLCGLGVVGSFGSGTDALMAAMAATGEAQPHRSIATGAGDVSLPVHEVDLSPLNDHFPSRTLRRVNRFGKMVLLAAHQAIADAGVADSLDRSRLGIVLGTGYGSTGTTFEFLDTYHESNNTGASPLTFSYSVHSSALSTATIFLGIRGPAVTVNQLEASTWLAVDTACQWLESNRVDAVLVGGCDEYCDMLGYTYARLFGPTFPEQADLRDLSVQSAIPGEGATFALLSRAPMPKHYASIRRQPSSRSQPSSAPGLRFVGHTGHPTCSRAYRDLVQASEVPTVSLANLTGSFPTQDAVHLAAGALMLANGLDIHDGYRMNDAPVPCIVNDVELVGVDQRLAPTFLRLTASSEGVRGQ